MSIQTKNRNLLFVTLGLLAVIAGCKTKALPYDEDKSRPVLAKFEITDLENQRVTPLQDKGTFEVFKGRKYRIVCYAKDPEGVKGIQISHGKSVGQCKKIDKEGTLVYSDAYIDLFDPHIESYYIDKEGKLPTLGIIGQDFEIPKDNCYAQIPVFVNVRNNSLNGEIGFQTKLVLK